MTWKKNKYKAKQCKIDGINFPSLLEMRCYSQLKLLQQAGEFKFFLMQIPFSLPGGVKHKIDFAVFYEEQYKFIEAKGRDLPIGKLKRKQVEDIYGITVHVVKNEKELTKVLAK